MIGNPDNDCYPSAIPKSKKPPGTVGQKKMSVRWRSAAGFSKRKRKSKIALRLGRAVARGDPLVACPLQVTGKPSKSNFTPMLRPLRFSCSKMSRALRWLFSLQSRSSTMRLWRLSRIPSRRHCSNTSCKLPGGDGVLVLVAAALSTRVACCFNHKAQDQLRRCLQPRW